MTIIFILSAPFSYAQSLRILYMAQAGYDPLDVQACGIEFTQDTGIAVQFQFEEYEDIYELVTGPEGQNGMFDIVLLDNIWTADFAARGIVEPVPAGLKNKITNGIIPEIYRANVYKNQMWGVPFLANFQLLYTNMDLLKAAGFFEPPQTLQEMKRMSFAAKEQGVIDFPFFDSLRQEEILMCEILWLSGAFGNEWASGNGNFVFDNESTRKAVEFLIEMKKEGLLNPYSLQSGEVFAADVFQYGDALFTTNWTFLIGRLQGDGQDDRDPFEFQISVLPTEKEEQPSSTVSGFQGLAVMRTSENKNAAWEFIEYLSSPGFQKKYLDEFPVWKEVWEDKETVVKDKYFEIKKEQVEGAKFRPVNPRYQEISKIIIFWVYKTLCEEVSIEEAFGNIQRQLEELNI